MEKGELDRSSNPASFVSSTHVGSCYMKVDMNVRLFVFGQFQKLMDKRAFHTLLDSLTCF